MRKCLPFLLVLSCGGAPVSKPQGAPTTVDVAPPTTGADGRLPQLAIPSSYRLFFDVDPSRDHFSGTTRIALTLNGATRFVLLHGKGLNVSRATVRSGDRTWTGTPTLQDSREELLLTFAEQLPSGEAELEIEYAAPFGKSLGGLYRVKDGEADYAFTHFEPTEARTAFPCFDEPSFKVPVEVEVRVPKQMAAFSNSPEAKRGAEGDRVRVTFERTPPIPTYLVALAVGDFEVKEGGSEPVPLRLITAKGKAPFGEDALRISERVLRRLTDYFELPYPYAKMDIVAVPDFGPGAMENPGLVMFRESLLLSRNRQLSVEDRRSQFLTIAHEFAHQWFGNLVTAAWWNELWLNESFASWMETKVAASEAPDLDAEMDLLEDGEQAMDVDVLPSSRSIRQPVRDSNEALEAFDQITYSKGAHVLAMIERFVGKEEFRKGIQKYLQRYSWKAARSEDLFNALSESTGHDVKAIADSFVNQPGVPTVVAERTCEANGWTMVLTQHPWSALGEPPPPQPLKRWVVPVCTAWDGTRDVSCTLLSESHRQEQKEGKCPAWIHPNAQQTGYYRVSVPSKQFDAMVASGGKGLSPESRALLPRALWSQVRAGTLDVTAYLSVVKRMDGMKDVQLASNLAFTLADAIGQPIEPKAKREFLSYVRERLRPRAKMLGWAKVPRETVQATLARNRVLATLASAEDEETLKTGRRLAERWLEDRSKADYDLFPLVLGIAAKKGILPFYEKLYDEWHTEKDPNTERALLTALGSFDDPILTMRTLDLMIRGEIKKQDARTLLRAVAQNPESRATLLEWTMTHFEEAQTFLSGPLGRRLLNALSGICSTADLSRARMFFSSRIATIPGGARPYALALEKAEQCAHLRPVVEAAFAK